MEKLNVFMIMPFQEEFLELYGMIKEKLKDKYEFSNAGDLESKRNILQDIVVGIAQADVIIADVTQLNPNVFYELGLCHALDKKVILITQDINELPFDIRSYRVSEYQTNFWKIKDIIDEIEKILQGVQDGSVQFGNPIKDYYPSNEKEKLFKKNEITPKENISGEDRGFLDFMADINEDIDKLSNEIEKMVEEQNIMTKQMEDATDEITRVSKSPSSGNASLIRNITRKVGIGIQDFANKMKMHNTEFENIWERVENNFLDLIDNKYMENQSNKEGLIVSLKALCSMKKSILESNEKIDDMISNFMSLRGIERKLTQAINSLEEQMKTYLYIMKSAISTIDRIINKSELLIGKIDWNSNNEN